MQHPVAVDEHAMQPEKTIVTSVIRSKQQPAFTARVPLIRDFPSIEYNLSPDDVQLPSLAVVVRR